MPRTRGRGAQHEQRRGEIVRAVLAVVAEQGVSAVSLTSAAGAAAVSPGRVQYYFPTKEALLEAAFDQANAEASARITAQLGDDQASAPPREVLTLVLTGLIPSDTASWNHLRIRQAFAALALHDETIAARLRTEYTRLHHRDLGELLRAEQDAGQLAAELDPVVIAIRLVALAEGLAYYVLIGAHDSEAARADILAAITDLYD